MGSEQNFYPQHHRLHSCIQSALCGLEDPGKSRTKKRLKKLMSLIPNDPDPITGILFMCVVFNKAFAMLYYIAV